ncbi:protein MpARF-like [Marchantia polymorpha subsp. ruderalis]|uniref:Auxin response factor domain-containing protein n=2 Tax=Marchantia polymorpha TaxID=3197 RepID=A0AAF6B375_MARPO|nr:hypothetical protein MARPO_0160s0029 [Marchantia polymorpha]BBN06459.1 hypothetical protein Mp_3g21340 [Marchantia polymorpha subsp. ruderalis]|eukprot:PTQ28579.1 hypothetical protein MARPO_0160s0029 [Marchantia polymorpha]
MCEPLVSVPTVGSRMIYFPQGHSEQVAASIQKEADVHISNYPSLPLRLNCLLDNVTLHADMETDEVYTRMTLLPMSGSPEKELWYFRHIYRGQPRIHLLTTRCSVFVNAKRLQAGDFISVEMRFKMVFETKESDVQRYMETITGIGDVGPLRWPSSH